MADEMQAHQSATLPPLTGYLFTPPENMADSFSKDVGQTGSMNWHNKLAPIHSGAPSPPITPEMRVLGSFGSSQDAPLFSTVDARSSPHADAPLFDTEPQQPSPVQSVASRSGRPSKGNLGGVIGPGVYIENSPAGAKEYYLARMAELAKFRTSLPKPSPSAANSRDAYSTRQVQALGRPVGITKPRSSPVKTVAKPKAAKATQAPPKSTTPARRTPKATTMKDFVENAFPSMQAPKHKRAAPSKKVEGKEEDKKWRELPDYSPPIESLSSAPKPLKADWKAEPKDISGEPDAEALNPAEYALASGLRLLPQQYLANKRRMFQARVQHLKDGKNFTKTAAQLACNIDVNKASSLWEAFNRVGWFRESWFEHLV